MRGLLTSTIVLLGLACRVLADSDGAPTASCHGLHVIHGNAEPQEGEAPYYMVVEPHEDHFDGELDTLGLHNSGFFCRRLACLRAVLRQSYDERYSLIFILGTIY